VVVRLDTLQDWCLKRGSQLAEEASKYLEERQAEYDVLFAEQEKRKKGKKKGKEEEPELNPDDFKTLSEEILVRMLKERLSQEDCNAGAIFDCLDGEYWPDVKEPFPATTSTLGQKRLRGVLKLITDAVPRQNLQVLLLRFQKDLANAEDDGEPAEVCTNYRFARRAAGTQPVRKEDKAQDADAAAVKVGKKTKGVAKPPRGAKAGKKGEKEEDEKPAEQLEAEKK